MWEFSTQEVIVSPKEMEGGVLNEHKTTHSSHLLLWGYKQRMEGPWVLSWAGDGPTVGLLGPAFVCMDVTLAFGMCHVFAFSVFLPLGSVGQT